MHLQPSASLGFLSIHPNKNAKETHPANMVRDHVKTPINSVEDAAQFMLTRSWSSAIWRDGHARNENFIEAWGIPLDVDKGIDLEEAMWFLAPFDHVICTTKSHQKWKENDPPRDRYRVYLPTFKPIDTAARFSATVGHWIELLGADTNGRAPAQHYKPADAIYSIQCVGNRIPIEEPPPPPKPFKGPPSVGRMCEIMATNIMMNFSKYEGRQRASFVAAMRMKEGGRSTDYTIAFINSLTDLGIKEVQQAVQSAFRR